MTTKKTTSKTATEASSVEANTAETPSAEAKAPTKAQKAETPSIEVIVHTQGLEVTGRRDEVNGGVTTVHLEVGPAKERYPDQAYPSGEEVSPDVSDGEDQPSAPPTDR